jgi:NAD(P)H-dependent FMN reductase
MEKKMGKKVVAIGGSYRKNGITDQAVDAALRAARQEGAYVKKIYLTDARIEFCTNCRVCTAEVPERKRGRCVINDEIYRVLAEIESADGLIFAAPVNFGGPTAVMKRFIERLIMYTFWPWGVMVPKPRIKARNKKAVVITSSSCPAFIGRLLMPNTARTLKASAGLLGAKVVRSLHFGLVAKEAKQRLTVSQVKKAEAAGMALVGK